MEISSIEELKYRLVQACEKLDKLQVSLCTKSGYDMPNHVDCRERILDAMRYLDKVQTILGINAEPKIEDGMVKVNVWQLGYITFKDFLMHNKDKAVLRPNGYVVVENKEGWQEEVWHLLNWSCWSDDIDGNPIKPKEIYSTLDHCNSDIIINIEGTDEYWVCLPVGWDKADSLHNAVLLSKKNGCSEYWPFPEVKRGPSGHRHREGDKVFIVQENGEKVEITW